MAQIFVKYNPYRLQTFITVNGQEIESDSALQKYVKGKRLQEWIGDFPRALVNELNSLNFEVEFYGMELDWDDFEFAFKEAHAAGIIKLLSLKFTQGKTTEDIAEKIVQIFNDLCDGPVEDFRDPKLLKAFNNIEEAVFPVNVIATMSSGKSTLINALLQQRLMPSKNEACTATITEITDNDGDHFQAIVYNKNDELIQEIPQLTYEIMDELNSNEDVQRIVVEGDIPFIDARSTALCLVDTPGPNNSQNQAHKNTTYKAINNDSNNLILYVLNGTQLSTNDDAALLDYVADQIKKGGKQVRDRFLFVINKMDSFNPDEEDISKAVLQAKKYLSYHGIEDPQIFPCSAFTALNISTVLKDIDIDNLTRAQERQLPSAARSTLPMIYQFVDSEQMHLEQYSVLAPSTKRELEYKLKQAQDNNDTKAQALIHCGISSIEAAITAYVKKYARTKKVKDLVESFQEVLESSQVLVKAKTKVATDEDAAKKYAARAEAVKAKINNGQDAKKFKERIAKFDPMKKIQQKAEALKDEASLEATRIFRDYGDTITSKTEAQRLVKQFARISSDAIAKMSAELESVINKEVVKTGETMLIEYQEKLTSFDENTADKDLDFNTVDLIKGALQNMRESVGAWNSNEFISDTVDEVGESKYETRKYHVKVGQKPEEIITGQHVVTVGKRKVKNGSHIETEKIRVKNPDKKWWSFWRDEYIYKEVQRVVDDYKEVDVTETVLDYKTVMRDVYEERTERIEKFSMDTSKIQTSLVAQLRKNADMGIDNALKYSANQINSMKSQFMKMFDELDKLIAQKYDELKACAEDQKDKEASLLRNRQLLGWIEKVKADLNSILEI